MVILLGETRETNHRSKIALQQTKGKKETKHQQPPSKTTSSPQQKLKKERKESTKGLECAGSIADELCQIWGNKHDVFGYDWCVLNYSEGGAPKFLPFLLFFYMANIAKLEWIVHSSSKNENPKQTKKKKKKKTFIHWILSN